MTGSGPAKSTQPRDDVARPIGPDMALAPLSPGGLFEAFPGPALVVASNGVVLSANDRAEPVVKLLQGEATGQLRGTITAASRPSTDC